MGGRKPILNTQTMIQDYTWSKNKLNTGIGQNIGTTHGEWDETQREGMLSNSIHELNQVNMYYLHS